MENFLTVATVALLFMEGVKFIVRKWVVKDLTYNFSVSFYVIALPVLQLLAQPVLVYFDILDPVAVTLSLKTVLSVFFQSMASVFIYNGTAKPFKAYARR